MRNVLTNERHVGESFEDYRARRKVTAKVIKARLRGTLAHVSAKVGVIPEDAWTQEHVDAALHGKLVRMGTAVVGGKAVNLVRDKGTTYRKPKEVK